MNEDLAPQRMDGSAPDPTLPASLRDVAELAGRQHGVVTGGDLHRIGMSTGAVNRWAERGYLRRMHRGVYTVGHDLVPVRGQWLAAVRAYGFAVLSHRSAAQLWGLADPRPPIEVTVAPGGASNRKGVRTHQSRHLDRSEITILDSIPVTSLPRTLLDIGAVWGYEELEESASDLA